jgi:hypothetical protein
MQIRNLWNPKVVKLIVWQFWDFHFKVGEEMIFLCNSCKDIQYNREWWFFKTHLFNEWKLCGNVKKGPKITKWIPNLGLESFKVSQIFGSM